MKFVKNDEPTPLEALRPVVECDTADLLRFMNFCSALQRWYSLKVDYDRSGTQSVELNYKEEYSLYVATLSLQDRLYSYDLCDPEGKMWRLDRDFIALFPEQFPPMFDGTVFTFKQLLRMLKDIRSRIFVHLRKAAEEAAQKRDAEEKKTPMSPLNF